jgi:DNA (cytosine-5)-methyltransferase 3A
MNVLSLFDGISCGMVALERAGIKVDKYYASEIDKYAIQISKKNYPNIIQLGDITKWQEWDIDWANIDLLIGGSPCQGFSFSGKMLNFEDPRSKLFFVFVDILNHIKQLNPNIKFLLENVRMKQEWQDVINKHLGVKPVLIN